MAWDDDPVSFEAGRVKSYIEVKKLVEDQFKNASEEARMALIGQIMAAHCTLHAARHIAHEISSGLVEVATAIREAGEN